MSKKEQLLEHYGQTLTSLCQVPDAEGRIHLEWPDEEGRVHREPTVVEMVSNEGEAITKALVLPIDSAIAKADAGAVYFHPLSENIIRGESEVLKSLRTMVKFRINATALTLMEIITELATADSHKGMTSKQQVVLKVFANATKKAKNEIRNVLDKYFDKITSVYLKRTHMLDGDNYRRVASITFPLRAMIQDGSKMVGDYEMSSLKNTKVLAELIDYMFPKNDDPVLWSAGSNSDAAPYYESLMLAYANMGERLNKLIKIFKKHIPNADELTIPLEFKKGLQNITHWKLAMRPLEGNIGAVLRGERGKEQVEQVATAPTIDNKSSLTKHLSSGARTTVHQQTPIQTAQPQQPLPPPTVGGMMAPAVQNAPAESNAPSTNGKSWSEIKSAQGIQSQPMGGQYNPNTMMYNPGMMQPQMGYQQPMMGMQPQMGTQPQMGMYPQMGMQYPQMGMQQQGYPAQSLSSGYGGMTSTNFNQYNGL